MPKLFHLKLGLLGIAEIKPEKKKKIFEVIQSVAEMNTEI